MPTPARRMTLAGAGLRLARSVAPVEAAGRFERDRGRRRAARTGMGARGKPPGARGRRRACVPRGGDHRFAPGRDHSWRTTETSGRKKTNGRSPLTSSGIRVFLSTITRNLPWIPKRPLKFAAVSLSSL